MGKYSSYRGEEVQTRDEKSVLVSNNENKVLSGRSTKYKQQVELKRKDHSTKEKHKIWKGQQNTNSKQN